MKKVAIVGVGGSFKEAPFDDLSYEIWGLNHYYDRYPRWDLWFNMHYDYEKKGHITQANYPYSRVLKLRTLQKGDEYQNKYFASTVSYMSAYAIIGGYDEIFYVGCDFESDDELRSRQKECLEQWIAFAQGRGIKIRIAKSSPLCLETGFYGRGKKDVLEK